MSSHISDEPELGGQHAPAHRSAGAPTGPPRNGATDPPPPVDPKLLDDYEQFQAWKAMRAEAAAANDGLSDDGDSALDPFSFKLRIRDGETVHEFTTVDVTDENVLAHLQVLVTFAESDTDRAAAVFEAVLGSIEYVRLQKMIKPMLRRIEAAHAADPDNCPSVLETWQNMISTVAKPIQELASDPKRLDSLRGRSSTGRSSKTGSPPAALPSS
jgi:hypothetical protein